MKIIVYCDTSAKEAFVLTPFGSCKLPRTKPEAAGGKGIGKGAGRQQASRTKENCLKNK